MATTFAELREAEQQKFLEALRLQAYEYAETAAHGHYFTWMKLTSIVMSSAPHLRWYMTCEKATQLRTSALKAMRNPDIASAELHSLLGWEPLKSEWRPDRADEGIVREYLIRVVISIHLFSNAKEEAALLMWRHLKMIIDAFAAEWLQGYDEMMISDPRLICGGNTMEDVPAGEADRRELIMENMPERYLLPEINAPLVWTAS